MDSKERHELMTNELSAFIGRLPELIKEYRNQLIGVCLIIVGLISWPILNRWRAESDFGLQSEISSVMDQLEEGKILALRQQDGAQGDSANLLLAAANNLAEQVTKAPNNDLAALVLIKQGQALRTELHFRKELSSDDVVSAQIKQAQIAYQQAAEKAQMPILQAMAQYGLGLCSEELGQTEQAKEIYQKITADKSFAGLHIIVLASERIKNMADNSAGYKFVEAPKPAPVTIQPSTPPAAPTIQASPANPIPAEPAKPETK